MVELDLKKKLLLINWWNCIISFSFVVLTHVALTLVPRFFSSFLIFIQLVLSALVQLAVVGSGRWCRRIFGVNASASAFVLFNILFLWVVYIIVIRKEMSFLTNLVFNGEVLMLIVGMCSIISSDPGLVACNSSPSDKLIESDASASELRNELPNEDCAFGGRVRYCKRCKANVQGFDHHCPAFGNCVGQNNHRLFMVLLIGFIITEASYIVCSLQFATKSEILDTTRSQNGLTGNLASSTMLFSVLQMAWQVLFLMWHIYCVCFNIRTEEWINWKKYPEFHLSNESQTGNVRFRNPYHKGVLQNLKDFLALKG